jgi:predicted amidohydrolase
LSVVRIALANLRFPESREQSIVRAEDAVARAAGEDAAILCFPECYVPGYRAPGKSVPPLDAAFLERAWTRIAAAAATNGIAVVLGTERVVEEAAVISALVIDPDGTIAGHQDRVQTYADPANTFHEKAALCRAAENTRFFATVNYASPGSPTTSAVVRPDGTLLCHQPYGREGLLIADIDTSEATGLLAARCKSPYASQVRA